MRQTQYDNKRLSHPVDFIERIADGHNWLFERTAEDEISISVGGNWAEYDVSFSWLEDREALHISCAFDLFVPEQRQGEIQQLLTRINNRMVMGHFDFWPESGLVIYRQALLLAGGLHPSDTQVELLLMNALTACESHHQACQIVCSSLVSAAKALQYSLFETVGSA